MNHGVLTFSTAGGSFLKKDGILFGGLGENV